MTKKIVLSLLVFLLFAPMGRQQARTEHTRDYITPIVLSLIPGQRFEISRPEDGVLFDINGDGTKSLVAWPVDTKNIGFLYNAGVPTSQRDVDIDTGRVSVVPLPIHSGNNLFANIGYENGFKELASWDDPEFDKGIRPVSVVGRPKDGVITENDGVWKNLLRVWLDLNRNGLLDKGELKTLNELKIEMLELNYTVSDRKDVNGNRSPLIGRFWKKGDQQPYFMTDYLAAVKAIK